MPSVTQNIDTWDSAYDWTDQGEEWSRPWGGSEGQWYGSIFPRVQRLLPAPTVLEIAPGYGRWTAYLGSLRTTGRYRRVGKVCRRLPQPFP